MVRDDLGAFEELVPPDVIAVLVGVDHAPEHGLPDLAEELNHLAPVGQVGLGVDDAAAAQVDEPGICVADEILLVQDGEAVVADLLQYHYPVLLVGPRRVEQWPVPITPNPRTACRPNR